MRFLELKVYTNFHESTTNYPKMIFMTNCVKLLIIQVLCHESHHHRKGLQIPIFGTSELQIRWNWTDCLGRLSVA